MNSKITIDFTEDMNPSIRLKVASSEDVRDKLCRRFIDDLGHTSNLCEIMDISRVPGDKEFLITPVTKSQFEDKYSGLPSRFQIGDKVKYTTDAWVEAAFAEAKKANPAIPDDFIEYTPEYTNGEVVGVLFTESKVYYDLRDVASNQVVKNIDSSYTKIFEEIFAE